MSRMGRWWTRLGAILLGVVAITSTLPAAAAVAFADPAFRTTWQMGESVTPNFWGPLGNAGDARMEQYLYSGTNRSRLVQYFDKGRMERYDAVTDQPGTKVTSGLLAAELITGQIQIADDQFMPKTPPNIPVAGDANAPGVTYAALAGKAKSLLDPATSGIGNRISTGLTTDGDLAGGVLPANPGTTLAVFDAPTRHNVTRAFVDYRTRAGLTNIGYARSEPFVATFKVGGKDAEVIVQVFERRVLTYTASNRPEFQVEMGNIGQHYARWRYDGNSSQQPIVGTPPTATATAANTLAPTATVRATTVGATATPIAAATTGTRAATTRILTDMYNCDSFESQAESQAYLEMYPSDPSRLDANNNNVACENFRMFPVGMQNLTPIVRNPAGPVAGTTGVCPSGFPIKVIPGTRMYLAPGQARYVETPAFLCYTSMGAVEALGFMKTP